MNGKLYEVQYEEIFVVDPSHPPIEPACKFAADQGELKRGLIVAYATGSDEYVPYDPAADDGTEIRRGVLTQTIDTTGDVKVETVLKHGMYIRKNCHVSGVDLSDADVSALEAIGLFAN